MESAASATKNEATNGSPSKRKREEDEPVADVSARKGKKGKKSKKAAVEEEEVVQPKHVEEEAAPVSMEADLSAGSEMEQDDAEIDSLRERLEAAGGAVSILGGSLDDWGPSGRRSTEERAAFLLPQLRAAARLGATRVQLPR